MQNVERRIDEESRRDGDLVRLISNYALKEGGTTKVTPREARDERLHSRPSDATIGATPDQRRTSGGGEIGDSHRCSGPRFSIRKTPKRAQGMTPPSIHAAPEPITCARQAHWVTGCENLRFHDSTRKHVARARHGASEPRRGAPSPLLPQRAVWAGAPGGAVNHRRSGENRRACALEGRHLPRLEGSCSIPPTAKGPPAKGVRGQSSCAFRGRCSCLP